MDNELKQADHQKANQAPATPPLCEGGPAATDVLAHIEYGALTLLILIDELARTLSVNNLPVHILPRDHPLWSGRFQRESEHLEDEHQVAQRTHDKVSS